METLALPDAATTSTEPELNLLLPGNAQQDGRRGRFAAIASVVFHVVAICVLLALPDAEVRPLPPQRYLVRHVTPLYTPPELTQKAPNKGPVKKELTLVTIAPRPATKAPAPAPRPAPKQIAAAKALPMPSAPVPQPVQKTVAAVEPPKIEAPPAIQPAPQPAQITGLSQLPPPPGSGAPRLKFEDVATQQAPAGKPTGLIPVPGASVQEAVRALNHGGSSGGEISFDQGGAGAGLNLPASAGRAEGGIRLLSNPEGVDFRPYLIQVMAAIRRNWFAVYPEAAKTGIRGEVILQFRVAKGGIVAKVVYNGQSSSRPLNEAAVSAISASNPFPALPGEFKGDHVDLQMRFLYNVPK